MVIPVTTEVSHEYGHHGEDGHGSVESVKKTITPPFSKGVEESEPVMVGGKAKYRMHGSET